MIASVCLLCKLITNVCATLSGKECKNRWFDVIYTRRDEKRSVYAKESICN